MILLPPETIEINQQLLDEADQDLKAIYRLIVFGERYHAVDLLTRYQEAIQHLQTILGIKNAQQEAQSVEEAREYLRHLKACMAMIIAEISEQRNFERPADLLRLFRIITPETAVRHPNSFRQTCVQFGPFFAPEPQEINGLIEQLFAILPELPHPLIRAAYLHHELVRIHPFVDGNGRVSRMAKNWLLMYDLYPPIFIYGVDEHHRYISSLQNSFLDLARDPHRFGEYTRAFFESELRRIKASTGFILNRMRNNPGIMFGKEDLDSTPYRA